MNLKKLKEQTGADEERLQFYISLFNEMLPQYVSSLNKGINEADLSTILDIVHSSKVLLQMLGFQEIFENANDIEQMIKAEESYDGIAEKVQKFITHLESIIAN